MGFRFFSKKEDYQESRGRFATREDTIVALMKTLKDDILLLEQDREATIKSLRDTLQSLYDHAVKLMEENRALRKELREHYGND